MTLSTSTLESVASRYRVEPQSPFGVVVSTDDVSDAWESRLKSCMRSSLATGWSCCAGSLRCPDPVPALERAPRRTAALEVRRRQRSAG